MPSAASSSASSGRSRGSRDKKGELAAQLERAFADPEKHACTPEQLDKLTHWLPEGMAFSAIAAAKPKAEEERPEGGLTSTGAGSGLPPFSERNQLMKKPYSVLLLYPDYANDSGTETYYAFVEAADPIAADCRCPAAGVANEGEDIDPTTSPRCW